MSEKPMSDAEWLVNRADAYDYFDSIGDRMTPCMEAAKRYRTIAATLPPPYSQQPPTVEGWYWFREKYHVGNMCGGNVVRVKRPKPDWPLLVYGAGGNGVRMTEFKGEWSGPIPQPPKGQA